MISGIEENLIDINTKIENAAERSGRCKDEVTLVAVSKRQPLERVLEFIQISKQMGSLVVLGENYVQEFEEKSGQLSEVDQVHFIGGLQSNKAAKAVQLFDLIETVDSEKLARAINRVAEKSGVRQRLMLQVNISDDPAKRGLRPAKVPEIVELVSRECPQTELEGLMAITQLYSNPEQARADFTSLSRLKHQIQQSSGVEIKHLSMGMSSDFEIAIEEGATFVRIGSSLFGERSK